MKNYRNSDYAANKNSKGVVYRFANQTIEITLEDYLRENPDKNEADFTELKSLSDEIYLKQVRAENAQTKKNVSIHRLEATTLCCVASPENTLIAAEEQAENQRQRRKIAAKALSTLTEVQRRRYLMYVADEFTIRQIADLEGSHFTSVSESICAAKQKIKKYLMNI